jgi:hypothetical protein
VIYDKFDGEFASRSLTYASTGNVRYQCEVTSVIGTKRKCRSIRTMSVYEVPAQPVDTTQALNLSAGVSNCKVSRGRSLS